MCHSTLHPEVTEEQCVDAIQCVFLWNPGSVHLSILMKALHSCDCFLTTILSLGAVERNLDMHNGGWKGLRKMAVGCFSCLISFQGLRNKQKGDKGPGPDGDNLRKTSQHNSIPFQQDTVHIIQDSPRIVPCNAVEQERVISSVGGKAFQ